MAKQNVQKSLKNLFNNKFSYDQVKKQTASEDVHLITFNPLDAKVQFQKGFKNAITVKSNGFTPSEQTELEKINTLTSWETAIRGAINSIKKDGTIDNIEPLGPLIRVKKLKGVVRGLYITPQSNSNNVTFVTLNRDVAGGDIGEKGISQALRLKTWEIWKSNIPSKYLPKIKLSSQTQYPGQLGRAVQFAHKEDSTIGTDFLRVFSDYVQNSMGEEWELGLNTQVVFFDIAEEIRQNARVDYSKKRVVDADGNVYEKRIIEGDLGGLNKKGSEQTDLSKIKKKMKELLDLKLDEAVKEGKEGGFINDADAILSKPFTDVATEETIRKLKLPLTKKGTVDRRFKKVKDFIKLQKNKPNETESYNAYKGSGSNKGFRRSRARVKATAIAVSREQNKNKTKQVNLARIMMLINNSLADTIKRNMGRPSLINRTGRFADSARVVSLNPAKQTTVASYTYQLNPYETFENTGERTWPAGYNPKPLIAKSIREEAAKYLETKLTLRRV